jgi:hypothetical protein
MSRASRGTGKQQGRLADMSLPPEERGRRGRGKRQAKRVGGTPPAFAFGWPAVRRALFGRGLPLGPAWACAGLGVVLSLSSGPWPGTVIGAAQVAIGVWLWRRGRRGGKRAPRAYGAKSRALVAALVAKARDAARPRPALRPAPGAAR